MSYITMKSVDLIPILEDAMKYIEEERNRQRENSLRKK